LIDNDPGAQPQKITVAELEEIAGIDIVPSVNQQVTLRGMYLPDQKERNRKRGR